MSYFHLNDVFIDVIPIVLTGHTVIDVVLTQVMFAGEKTRTKAHTDRHTYGK